MQGHGPWFLSLPMREQQMGLLGYPTHYCHIDVSVMFPSLQRASRIVSTNVKLVICLVTLLKKSDLDRQGFYKEATHKSDVPGGGREKLLYRNPLLVAIQPYNWLTLCRTDFAVQQCHQVYHGIFALQVNQSFDQRVSIFP